MNSKVYDRAGINQAYEKHHEVIVYIDGVLKEIREADIYPHLNNPERKRRLAEEFQISVEKYTAFMDFLARLYAQLLRENEEENQHKHKDNTNDALLKAMLKLPTDRSLLDEELKLKKYAEELMQKFDRNYERIMPLLNEKINTYHEILERANKYMQEQEKIAVERYKAVYESIPSHINTISYDPDNYFGNPQISNVFQFDEKELFSAVSKMIDATFVSEKLLYPSTQDKDKINLAEEKALRNYFIKQAEKHVVENYPDFDIIKKKECQKLIVDKAMDFLSPKRQEINRDIDNALHAPCLEVMKTRIEQKVISETLGMLNNAAEELKNDYITCHDKSMDIKSKCEKMEKINSKFEVIDQMLADTDDFLKDLALVFPEHLFAEEKNQADNQPSLELDEHRPGK